MYHQYPTIHVDGDDVNQTWLAAVYHKVTGFPRAAGRVLNPYNYFNTQQQIDNNFNVFRLRQLDPLTADPTLYPSPTSPLLQGGKVGKEGGYSCKSI